MKTIILLSVFASFLTISFAQSTNSATTDSLTETELVQKFDANGTLVFQVEVLDGVPHGKYVDYYASGAIRETRTYSHGLLHGESFRYSEKGSIIAHAMYENNLKMGTWKIMSDFSPETIVLTYENGIRTNAYYLEFEEIITIDAFE